MGNYLVLLQNNYVERMTGKIAVAARERGITVCDFSDGPDVEIPYPEGNWDGVLVYGSVQMVNKARNHPELSPWVHVNDEMANSRIWWDKRHLDMLNHLGRTWTAGEFTTEVMPWHVRPLQGFKTFNGGVMTGADVEQMIASNKISSDTELMVSPLRDDIVAEVRCFIVDRKIISMSSYRRDNQMCVGPITPTEHDLIHELVYGPTKWLPMAHIVCDVAILANGEARIVEFNPLHSSGWYACDHEAVMDAYFEWCSREPFHAVMAGDIVKTTDGAVRWVECMFEDGSLYTFDPATGKRSSTPRGMITEILPEKTDQWAIQFWGACKSSIYVSGFERAFHMDDFTQGRDIFLRRNGKLMARLNWDKFRWLHDREWIGDLAIIECLYGMSQEKYVAIIQRMELDRLPSGIAVASPTNDRGEVAIAFSDEDTRALIGVIGGAVYPHD